MLRDIPLGLQPYNYGRIEEFKDKRLRIPSAPRISIPILRNTPSDSENILFSAQYGDGYRAYGEQGINKRIETWSITTPPLDLYEALRLRNQLQGHYSTPFEWEDAPSSAQFIYYVVTPSNVRFTNQSQRPGLTFGLENWRNLA